MLIKFISSETGELLMFAEVAKMLLQILGKETSAHGAFLPLEMQAAANTLRLAVQQDTAQPEEDEEGAEEGDIPPMERSVSLNSRAWPLIDMLERTAQAGAKANIIWEAPADF